MYGKLIDWLGRFIVCPGFIDGVVKNNAGEINIFSISGGMMPIEIIRAEILSAKMFKLFSGSHVSPSFAKAIKPIFADFSFIPTRGVNITGGNLAR